MENKTCPSSGPFDSDAIETGIESWPELDKTPCEYDKQQVRDTRRSDTLQGLSRNQPANEGSDGQLKYDLSIFEHVTSNLKVLEIDDIVKLLGPLKIGMTIETPKIPSETFLYRGRKIDGDFNKARGIKFDDLIYPPAQSTRLGRVNRDKNPMFYCAGSKEVVFFELTGLTTGDEIVLSFWQTTEKMLVSNVGYTQYMFQKLGAKRECPVWSARTADSSDLHQELILNQAFSQESIRRALSKDENNAVRQAFSEAFMCMVGEEERHKYKLTTAIGELHLGEIVNSDIQFSGIMYPTVRMWGNGDNLALLPQFVDKHVTFKKAMHIRIDAKEGNRLSVTYLDSATEFSEDGTLKWLGRLSNWKLGPWSEVIAVGTAGRDKYGDYTIDQNGTPCYWVLTDRSTGKVIEPS